MAGLVLAAVAFVGCPVVWLVLDPIMTVVPGLLGLVCGVTGLVLSGVGLRRTSRGIATNRTVALAGVLLAVGTLLVGTLQAGLSGMAFDRDARALCSALAPAYTLDAYTAAITQATPGESAADQVERARLMVDSHCPGQMRGVIRVDNALHGIYG